MEAYLILGQRRLLLLVTFTTGSHFGGEDAGSDGIDADGYLVHSNLVGHHLVEMNDCGFAGVVR